MLLFTVCEGDALSKRYLKILAIIMYQIRRKGKWENFDSQVNADIDAAHRSGRALVLVETTTGERLVVVSFVF